MGIRRFNDSNGRIGYALTHVDAVIGWEGKTLRKILMEMQEKIDKAEPKTSVQSSSSDGGESISISAKTGECYSIDGTVNTLFITFPEAAEDLTGFLLHIQTGSTPDIHYSSSGNLYFSEGYKIEANTIYEINALHDNGTWYITNIKFEPLEEG